MGCSPSICPDEILLDACVDPVQRANPDRIRITQVNPHTDGVRSMSKMQFVFHHTVTFAGTVFGTGRNNVRVMADAFADTVGNMIGDGVPDTDQSVFSFMYASDPGLFEAYHTFYGEWRDVVVRYVHDGP